MFTNLDIDHGCSIKEQVSYTNDNDHKNNRFHSTEMHVVNYALDTKDGLIDYYLYNNKFDVNNEEFKSAVDLQLDKYVENGAEFDYIKARELTQKGFLEWYFDESNLHRKENS
ncbi:hypothetical protein [Psychrobacter sp. 72-O-c]|uniref:hypothetical protein n=1 Tax=Psychrobacter sp. 72-O-c TaxID=2774125 RepID=UPI0019192A9B|nr:hypothetical protein [Psychrobacter sp. 72-O-c]